MNMDNNNQGDNGNEGNPPATPPAGNNTPPQSQSSGENQKGGHEKVDAKLAEKQEQLRQLQEATQITTKELRDAREEVRLARKEAEDVRMNAKPNSDPLDDLYNNNSGDEPDLKDTVDKAVQNALETERQNNQKALVERTLSIFYKDHPEFDPNTDQGFINYPKLKEELDNYKFLGSSEEDIMRRIKSSYTNVTGKDPDEKPPESLVDDSGIGDTTRVQPNQDPNKPRSVTRNLNSYEKEAAKSYPGSKSKGYPKGEVGYRMSLAEREPVKTEQHNKAVG